MKEIDVKDIKVLVSSIDYDFLARHKWSISNSGYAVRTKTYRVNGTKKAKLIYLHREILQLSNGIEVDHINGNKLDNRRKNLRQCTRSQNQANRSKPKSNTSGYKGVCFDESRGKWRSYIKQNRKQKFLGYFDNPKHAHQAYVVAAKAMFGEFARAN